MKIFTQLNVSKHLRHLVDRVEAALHFKFVQHALLGLTGDRGLVKQAVGQEFGVLLDKYVTTMKAAEEAYNRIQPSLGLFVADSLEASRELFVSVASDKDRGLALLVHEVLE